VSFSAPTRIGLPSASNRFSACSVTQQPSALVASGIASYISSKLPEGLTVTATVTPLPDLLITFAMAPPYQAATATCRMLLE
jgi:hypothetical protein